MKTDNKQQAGKLRGEKQGERAKGKIMDEWKYFFYGKKNIIRFFLLSLQPNLYTIY
jgi:hypothetical protein